MKKNKMLLFLFLYLIIFSIFHFTFISNNTLPPNTEETHLIIEVVKLHHALKEDLKDGIFFAGILYIRGEKSFQAMISTVLAFITGLNAKALIGHMLIYSFILSISTFYIGKRLFNERIGLFAAIIVLALPGSLDLSRTYFDTYVYVSLVAMAIAFLLYSDHFKRLPQSILFAISASFAVFAKFTAPIYLMLPVLFILFKTIKKINKKRIINFASACAVWLIMSSYGLIKLVSLYTTRTSDTFNDEFQGIGNYLYTNFTFWKHIFLNYHLGKTAVFFMTALFILYIVKTISKKINGKLKKTDKNKIRSSILLIIWGISTFFIFVLLPFWNQLNTFGITISASLLIAYWADGTWRKNRYHLNYITVIKRILLGMLIFFLFTFQLQMFEENEMSFKILGKKVYLYDPTFKPSGNPYRFTPITDDFRMDEIRESIENHESSQKPYRLLLVDDAMYYQSLKLTLNEKKKMADVVTAAFPESGVYAEDYPETLKKFNYLVLIKDFEKSINENLRMMDNNYAIVDLIHKDFNDDENIRGFKKIDCFQIPNRMHAKQSLGEELHLFLFKRE